MIAIPNERLRERAREKVMGLELAVTQTAFSDTRAELEEELELARIAMASLDAEPVAWISERNLKNLGKSYSVYVKHEPVMVRPIPLYTAPPAPVVDADDNFYSWFGREWHEHYQQNQYTTAAKQMLGVMAESAWKAGRRAAMLQGAEPVTAANKLPEETGSSLQLRNLIRQRHAEWSQTTFGDVGPVGPLKHLSKEALEAAAEPDDLSEWADMQFLLWDAQRRAGICDGEITAAMEEKLKVNMARQWPEPKDGEPRLHIKEAGNSPVIPDGSEDTKRLDWLDAQNKRLNEYYGTSYGWKFDANFQRNAMMLNDSNYPVMSVRQAIDEAIAAAPQQEAMSSALEHGMARYSGAMQKLADGCD